MPTKTNAVRASANAEMKRDEALHAATIETRKRLRDELFATEDDRQFYPLDYSLIRPLVKDEYLDIFDHAVQTGKKCSVEIDLNKGYDKDQPIEENAGYKFIHAWLKANGKNRTPKEGHYGTLATGFRKEFASDATHWVIDSNGMVSNGGHSGHGVALAFYPESVEYGIYGKPIPVKEGESLIMFDSDEARAEVEAYNEDFPNYIYARHDGVAMQSNPLPWKQPTEDGKEKNMRVGEYDENGYYIPHSDSPDIRLSQDLTIVLRINADPTSCLKMDDVRLEASFDDYLEMVAPIRAYLSKLPKQVQEIAGTLFRNYYLRINHGNESFGSLGKGGRLTKNEVQQWFVAGLPHLLDSIELLKNELGVIKQFTHFTPIKGGKGQVSLANALVAMMVSTQSGRERIAKVLTETYSPLSSAPAYFKKLQAYIIKQPGDSTPAPNADSIVQALVFLGEGKQDPVECMLKAYPSGKKNAKEEDIYLSPWQVQENRVTGWDRGNTDEPANEEFTSVCIEAATRIAELLGSEGDVKNAKMKATRKGVGVRGRNKTK